MCKCITHIKIVLNFVYEKHRQSFASCYLSSPPESGGSQVLPKRKKKPPSAPDSMSQGQRQHSAPRGVSPGPHSYPPECLLPGSPTSILSQLNSPRWPFTLTCSAHILTLGKVMPPLNRAPSHSVIWLFPSLRPTDWSSRCFLQMQNTGYKTVIHYVAIQSGERKKKTGFKCT